ncbi:MAG: PDR/VanB family oxidoreductase, partial [Dermatophilaceae bacterium]
MTDRARLPDNEMGSVPRDFPVTGRIERARSLAVGVHELRVQVAGVALTWQPGAHVDIGVGPGEVRQYSLCGDPEDDVLTLAVQLEPDGRGGSQEMHRLGIGDDVTVHTLRNTFPLLPAERYRFVAGGIGITPFPPMLRAAVRDGADVQLLYGGRTRSRMAYLDRLVEEYGERVAIWPEDELGRPPLHDFLADLDAATHVYACGPDGLLDAVAAATSELPDGRVHIERFEPAARGPVDDGQAFEVRCATSGMTLAVPSGQTVLGAAREAGIRVLSSCREGSCGTCETSVLAGVPDHRDSYLTEEERAANDSMMICVSRSHDR